MHFKSCIDCSSNLQTSDHNGHSGSDHALLIESGIVGFSGVAGVSVKVCITDSLESARSGRGSERTSAELEYLALIQLLSLLFLESLIQSSHVVLICYYYNYNYICVIFDYTSNIHIYVLLQ